MSKVGLEPTTYRLKADHSAYWVTRAKFKSERWDSNPQSSDPKSAAIPVSPRPDLNFPFITMRKLLINDYQYRK